ncbi:MAG: XdhC family protein, partial [Anaerolineae bacterium]
TGRLEGGDFVWLDEATCVVFLSHDEKLDNPALAVALNSPARYIGALGAEKTHRRRIAALQEMGFGPAQLARIHAPIGLNLGAQRPEEIAVSIIAQIVAAGRGEETQVFK